MQASEALQVELDLQEEMCEVQLDLRHWWTSWMEKEEVVVIRTERKRRVSVRGILDMVKFRVKFIVFENSVLSRLS